MTPEEERETIYLQLKCEMMLNESRLYAPLQTDRFCPGMFDTLLCWNDTPAGLTVNQSCPDQIGFDSYRLAYKTCTEDATWYSVNNRTWTNYTTCVNMDDLSWQQHVTLLYKTGYSVSLVALIVSIAIFSYFRSLRCARITLHMNLFTSFAINNALWLLWYRLISDIDTVNENAIGCQILHVILQYFLLTNYAWMLCEGVYLHTILVSAFVAESKLMLWMHLLGWLVPVVFIVPYTLARVLTNSTAYCWTTENKMDYILSGPVCVLIGLNLLFLCNIVRELLVKLRADSRRGIQTSNRPSRTAIQALRATLLLAPLLGLSYLIIPFRPENNQQLERIYDIMTAITSSFQGLCVTLLFCFCNSEVRCQVKRKWNNLMYRPRANSFTATTVTGKKRSASTKPHQKNITTKIPANDIVTMETTAQRKKSTYTNVPLISFNIPNTKNGHCEKTFAIIKHVYNELKTNEDIQWVVITDDDTILRYYSSTTSPGSRYLLIFQIIIL